GQFLAGAFLAAGNPGVQLRGDHPLELPLRGLLVKPTIHLRLVATKPPGAGDQIALAADRCHMLSTMLQERCDPTFPAHWTGITRDRAGRNSSRAGGSGSVGILGP